MNQNASPPSDEPELSVTAPQPRRPASPKGENVQKGDDAPRTYSLLPSVASDGAPEFVPFLGRGAFFKVVGSDVIVRQSSSPFDAPRVSKAPRSGAEGIALGLPIFGNSSRPMHFLMPGLCLVSGATEVGKTTFVNALSTLVPLTRLQTVEPFDSASETDFETFHNADVALARAIQIQQADPKMLVVVDSLRSVLFEMQGPATSKGMVATFFTQLTRVSNALAANGRTVVATINPMNTEADFVAEFLQRLSAAVSCTIVLESRSQSGPDSVAYSGYVVQRPLRKRKPFTFTTNKAASRVDNSAAFSFPAMTSVVDGASPSTVRTLESI